MKLETDNIYAYTADDLKNRINFSLKFKERDHVKSIVNYIHNDNLKLLIVSGLLRTGKTIMLHHALSNLDDAIFKKSAYISIKYSKQGIDFRELEHIIETLVSIGITIFCVDEATYIRGFAENSKELADQYCAIGYRIILSGSNSLAFWFAEKDPLFGRFEKIDTTWISYGEWYRLFDNNSIDSPTLEKYFQYGGILDSNGVPLNTARIMDNEKYSFFTMYIKSSIEANILNSIYLDDYHYDLDEFKDPYKRDYIISVLSKIIHAEGHRTAKKK